MRTVARAALAAALAGAVAAAAAAAEDSPADRLKTIERSIEQTSAREAELARKAERLQADAERLRRRAVEVAARARDREETLTALEERIGALATKETEVLDTLDRRRAQLATLIAALERMALHPPVALIALPSPPVDTVRSALLLRAAVPAVEKQAGSLRLDLETLAELRENMATARRKLADEGQRLNAERASLAGLIKEREGLAGRTAAERELARKRAARLAEKAGNVRDLIARLAARPPAATATPTPEIPQNRENSAPSGGLPLAGRIVRRFGENDELGQTARGISVLARTSATVVAPRGGTVVFAGPFRGLGRLLIIEHGREYHLLLAGFARIDAAVGDRVVAGEPVGSMSASEDATHTLYMELRRKGRPVNPLPWLAAGPTRVNG
jgi:septal ring factor EnvC (AmiA/AmiB activator)